MTDHQDFSLALHGQLVPGTEQDFCWSPYSVASALGLAAAASGGVTRSELLSALRVRSGEDLTGLLELLDGAAHPETIAGGESPELAVANTLWADEQLPVEPSYVRALADWPGNSVRTVDFRAEPEQARERINADVAQTTRDLIPELIEPGMIDSETVAALVNALYLKVSWTESFDEQATAPRAFHTPAGPREVETMRVSRSLGYAHRAGWQLVTIPAEGGLEAVVLLPDGDLGTAESSLDGGGLTELLAQVSSRPVELFLPKFEVTGSAQLNEPLEALGVRTLFTPRADFSPLTGHPLRISTVVHESVLRVDEHGLEGAAATAAMMRLVAAVAEPEPLRVEVDRPFLFLVRHRETGAIYFFSRVVHPG